MANIIAAISIAASAVTAMAFYVLNQRQARRTRKSKLFAEGLMAVNNFVNYPFLVARRSVGESREKLTNLSAAVHGQLDYYRDLIRLEVPELNDIFTGLVRAAHKDFDEHGKAAWEMRPVEDDGDMNRRIGEQFRMSDELEDAKGRCLDAMARQLSSRWY